VNLTLGAHSLRYPLNRFREMRQSYWSYMSTQPELPFCLVIKLNLIQNHRIQMEISSMTVYILVSMHINMVKRFKYAKKYIDQNGVVHEVKKNQLFSDRAVWMADEQQWRYFKWDKKRQLMKMIPISRVHASQFRWRGAV
jgi:hypothetical protein